MNKQGRAHRQTVPLSKIFSEFREFCELFTTFGDCLEAHGASSCMDADLVGELNTVVAVATRRDRSNNGIVNQSPSDVIRDFDHYRRIAKSFCQQTPENVQIHMVRCLAHGIAATSTDQLSSPEAALADSNLRYITSDNSALKLDSTHQTCSRWLHQSQAPIVRSFFRQNGCGEHLQSALRLSAFLAEMTVPTTNVTEAMTSPRYSVCVRHVSPKLFQRLINDTFRSLVEPTTTLTTMPAWREPESMDELLNEKINTFPILSISASTETGAPSANDWTIEETMRRQKSVVIPETADKSRYEDSADAFGVQLMMMNDEPRSDTMHGAAISTHRTVWPNLFISLLILCISSLRFTNGRRS